MIIYREYHKKYLHAITSRILVNLPILGNKNPDVDLGGKGSKGKKVHTFVFCIQFDLHSYFRAFCAILADFEIFYNFDHIFELSQFQKVAMNPWGRKFELKIQTFGQSNTANKQQRGQDLLCTRLGPQKLLNRPMTNFYGEKNDIIADKVTLSGHNSQIQIQLPRNFKLT